MMICPHCSTSNPPGSNFCQQCGQPMSPAPAPDATIAVGSLTQLNARGPRQQKLELTQLFAAKSRLVIGRAPDCDIYLPHPSVSRYHARVERRAEQLHLTDLSSINGTWLGGRRITESMPVHDGDRVGIGPYLLSLSGGELHQLDNSKSLRLEAHHLEKVVSLPGGGTRKILDDINLVVNPGEFVTLLGPSGCGKSTLMDALNGRRPATGGRVLANVEDFYKHFDSFRQSLGYVPQKDIVHTGLTVSRALTYTARLRLPLDTDPVELQARVEDVLSEMELKPHMGTLIGNLSGGQIKRVSLGAELLAQPSMLYIDEATSGLDAGTEARMMRLFRRLADQGRSIVCITHNVDNVDQCHLVLILARGKLMYYGPPAQAPEYFGVKRLSDIYDKLGDREPAEWEGDFRGSSLYREYVVERLTLKAPAPAPTAPLPEEVKVTALQAAVRSPLGPISDLLVSSKLMERFPPLADRFRDLEASVLFWRERLSGIWEAAHQFRVLTRRYLDLIWADRRGLRLLLLQAPIVAIFLLIGFGRQNFREEMPILRKLTDDEKRTLVVMKALNQALQKDDALTDEQKKALAQVKLTAGPLPLAIDAASALGVLRKLASDDLTESQKLALSTIHFTVTQDGEPVGVNALEMVRAWRQFQQSNIPEQLLRVSGSVVPKGPGTSPRFTYMLLFIVVMIVLWFGCNNAAKEIVKEESIYTRERAVNLHILPYLASKFVVLSTITIFHVAMLMLVLYGTLHLLAWYDPHHHNTPPDIHMIGYAAQFGMLSLLATTAVALGLLISACVATPDRANALLPYVLIPQMIFGGGILAVHQTFLLQALAMTLSPVYWAFIGVRLGADQFPPDFPLYSPAPDGVLWPCVALATMTVGLLLATAWFIKRKDV